MGLTSLKILRELAGETGVAFAAACDMDPARLSRVERGEPPFVPEIPRIQAHVVDLLPRILWGESHTDTDRKDQDAVAI